MNKGRLKHPTHNNLSFLVGSHGSHPILLTTIHFLSNGLVNAFHTWVKWEPHKAHNSLVLIFSSHVVPSCCDLKNWLMRYLTFMWWIGESAFQPKALIRVPWTMWPQRTTSSYAHHFFNGPHLSHLQLVPNMILKRNTLNLVPDL